MNGIITRNITIENQKSRNILLDNQKVKDVKCSEKNIVNDKDGHFDYGNSVTTTKKTTSELQGSTIATYKESLPTEELTKPDRDLSTEYRGTSTLIVIETEATEEMSSLAQVNITSNSVRAASSSYPKLGSRGEDVKNVQKLLNKCNFGYNLTEDGVFGQNTHDAVVDFQGRYNLTKDGIVGPKTMSKIEEIAKKNTGSTSNVNINYYPNAVQGVLTTYTLDLVKKAAKNSGNSEVTIASTIRTPQEQARLMYQNLERTGAKEQYDIYGSSGDKVIKVWEDMKKNGSSETKIRQAMTDKIIEVGSTNVSNHCYEPSVYKNNNTFDITYNGLSNKAGLRSELQKLEDTNKLKFIEENGCFHVQIYNSNQ